MRGRAPAAVVRAVFLSQCASRKGWPSLSVRFAQGALARLFSPPAHPMPGAPRRRPAACRPVRPPPGGGSHPQAARIRPVRFAHCPAGVPAGVRASPAPQGRPQLPAVQGQGNRGPFRFAPIGGCAPDTPEPAGRRAVQTKVYSVRLVPVCLARFTRKTNPVSDCFAHADNLHT